MTVPIGAGPFGSGPIAIQGYGLANLTDIWIRDLDRVSLPCDVAPDPESCLAVRIDNPVEFETQGIPTPDYSSGDWDTLRCRVVTTASTSGEHTLVVLTNNASVNKTRGKIDFEIVASAVEFGRQRE